MAPDRRPPPRPGSRPSIELEAVVGVARDQQRADQPKAEQVQRRQTLDGVAPPSPGSVAPPPRLPGELAPTQRAPNPLQRLTVRRPTPPSSAALARRSDPPTGIRVQPDEARSSSRPGGPTSVDRAQVEVLLKERAEQAKRIAELERDARAREEVRSPAATFPPPVTPAPDKAPSSAPSKTDAAIGKAVRTLAVKLATRLGWTPLLVALGVGGAGAYVAKPAAEPARLDAALARIEALERQDKLRGTQLNGALDREAIVNEFVKCLGEQQAEGFSQLLPAADKQGSAALPKPFVDKCRNRKP